MKITIRVQGGDSDVLQDVDGIVYFTFTKEPMAVTAPAISYKTKTSIVVKAEEDQEYICCEADKEITQEDDWENIVQADRADEFGNIEFSKLDTGNTYVVYTRNVTEAMAVKKSEKVTLSNELKDMEAVVKTSNKENIPGKITGWQKGGLVLRVPVTIKFKVYGTYEKDKLKDVFTSSDEHFGDFQDESADLDGKVRLNTFQNDYVELIGVENLGKGDHTFQFSLQVKYDDQIINQVEFSTVFSITEEDLEKTQN